MDEDGAEFLAQATDLPILGIGAQSDSVMTRVVGKWELQTGAETNDDSREPLPK